MKTESRTWRWLQSVIAVLVAVISVTAPTLLLLESLKIGGDPWRTGDWLIDYSGGFIRRGLAGEVLKGAANNLGLPYIEFITQVQIALHAIFVFSSLVIFLRKSRSTLDLALFCSPFFVLFYFYETPAAFRKELLFLVFLVAVLLVRYPKTKIAKTIFWTTILLTYLGLSFSHEVVLFSSPLLMLAFYLKLKKLGFHKLYFRYLLPVWIAFSTVAILVLSLSPISKRTLADICSTAQRVSTNDAICDGAINWMGFTWQETFQNSVNMYFSQPQVLLTFFLVIFLAAVPFYRIRTSLETKVHLSIAALSMSPLFLFGLDWGRWMAIYVISSTLIYFSEGSSSDQKFRNGFAEQNLFTRLGAVGYSFIWNYTHIGGFLKLGVLPYVLELFRGQLLPVIARILKSLF